MNASNRVGFVIGLIVGLFSGIYLVYAKISTPFMEFYDTYSGSLFSISFFGSSLLIVKIIANERYSRQNNNKQTDTVPFFPFLNTLEYLSYIGLWSVFYYLLLSHFTDILTEYHKKEYIPTIGFALFIYLFGFISIRTIMHVLIHENTFSGNIITNYIDDYFPRPRKTKIKAEAATEEGYHVKLNYQHLIEKLTRKLFICFFAIMLTAFSFIYIIYQTSLQERIAPNDNVMKQYTKMMEEILISESKIQEQQLSSIKEILLIEDKQPINSPINDSVSSLKAQIIDDIVKSENAIVNKISDDFFWVYFFRYLVVRLFIATVAFTIIGYLIRLYFRIREDRNDLIRKEEALSTLIFFLDSMEGYDPKTNKRNLTRRFTSLKDKIPEFPLLKLFDHTKPSKDSNSSDLLSEMNKLTSIHKNLLSNITTIRKEREKDIK